MKDITYWTVNRFNVFEQFPSIMRPAWTTVPDDASDSSKDIYPNHAQCWPTAWKINLAYNRIEMYYWKRHVSSNQKQYYEKRISSSCYENWLGSKKWSNFTFLLVYIVEIQKKSHQSDFIETKTEEDTSQHLIQAYIQIYIYIYSTTNKSFDRKITINVLTQFLRSSL